ncbi:hypothetical protein LZK77_32600 (plasmid) [Rhizobium leguminosarum]|nr:hypothetical protein LZK77_32600 [Rhizobium leguminosarum]
MTRRLIVPPSKDRAGAIEPKKDGHEPGGKGDQDDKEAERQRGSQRPIERRPEQVVDHGHRRRTRRPAQKARRHHVAGGECKDRKDADSQSGCGQRQDDLEERVYRASPEIPCGFDQPLIDQFRRDPDGQHHEGQIVVEKHEMRGERRKQQELQRLIDHAQPFQSSVDQPFGAENDPPGINPDDLAGIEGRQKDDAADAFPENGKARHRNGDRVSDQSCQ